MPWHVNGASYTGVSASVSAQDGSTRTVRFSPDGLVMLTLGDDTDRIYRYDLPAPYDIANKVYSGLSFLVNGQDGSPRDFWVSSDGLRLMLLGGATLQIFSYTFGTAWDPTSLTYDGVPFAPTYGVGEGPSGFTWKPDGLRCITVDLPDKLRSYTLTSALDLSTMSYDGDGTMYVIPYDSLLRTVFVNDAGDFLYTLGAGGDNVNEHRLLLPWELGTITPLRGAFHVGTEETSVRCLEWKPDGRVFWIVGLDFDAVFEYLAGGRSGILVDAIAI